MEKPSSRKFREKITEFSQGTHYCYLKKYKQFRVESGYSPTTYGSESGPLSVNYLCGISFVRCNVLINYLSISHSSVSGLKGKMAGLFLLGAGYSS
jgi:hypothetical protein